MAADQRVRQIINWLAVAAATLAMSLVMSATAQAAVLQEDVVIDQVIVNPCLGEPLHVTGIWHVVIRETTDQAGGTHTMFHLNARKFQGVTPSGVRYIEPNATNVVDNVTTEGATEHTVAATSHLVRVGESAPADDLYQHVTIHFTENANGELTADKTTIVVECN